MTPTSIGVLHPGAMGASVIAALVSNAHNVSWASHGRSSATRERATAAGASEYGDLQQLVGGNDLLISVCPPDQALSLAQAVADSGFAGTYVDANAVAPTTAQQIGRLFGQRYVDGGIIGPPAKERGSTRLYLSGANAATVAGLFAGSALQAIAMAEPGVAASALKMCYAGWTKGSAALLLAMRALAEATGIAEPLEAEWELSQPNLVRRVAGSAAGVAPKAWRFAGEMQEIAKTMGEAGLPSGFHAAAEQLYATLEDFKDADGAELDAVIAALLKSAIEKA